MELITRKLSFDPTTLDMRIAALHARDDVTIDRIEPLRPTDDVTAVAWNLFIGRHEQHQGKYLRYVGNNLIAYTDIRLTPTGQKNIIEVFCPQKGEAAVILRDHRKYITETWFDPHTAFHTILKGMLNNPNDISFNKLVSRYFLGLNPVFSHHGLGCLDSADEWLKTKLNNLEDGELTIALIKELMEFMTRGYSDEANDYTTIRDALVAHLGHARINELRKFEAERVSMYHKHLFLK